MAKPPNQPNFRILSPNAAKNLAQKKKPVPGGTGQGQNQTLSAQSTPEPNIQGPKLTPKRPFSAFFSNLRQRYAALPRPVQRTCRGLRILAPLVPISLFFSEHVMQVMWVRGPSMTPYLNEDYHENHTKSDMVLVSMMPSRVWPWERTRRLERGMVVTFRSPANSSHIAIKRVVGLPGDRVMTRKPCLKESQIVPFNHVWLEGDASDPERTLDSNTYGPVSISLLTGRVFAILGPRMRWLNWADWEDGKLDNGTSEGKNYRQATRDRVMKEAVNMENQSLD
ncbi:hypothetical protein N7509_005071 [Penicillium cosmopolitanum]|uniref:Mitochondrial inner membrane protease subunit 2 n=1 Tax=Penicillium cosmopolitanum TaxID=1131564 RepID=A0A9W9W1R1_9EURO|nr:uncharacterized protein N7509_005071 [Penicillium cosmopolitanum]KAJ5396958.1 hypothetical protein N7509_005071 [Penicillium cosmopolitanum]